MLNILKINDFGDLVTYKGKSKLGKRQCSRYNRCELTNRTMQHGHDAKDGTTWAQMCHKITEKPTYDDRSGSRTRGSTRSYKVL